MKKSTKAALLSGLVFPGLGHLYLKRWVPGIVLTGGAAYVSYSIMSDFMRNAMDVVHKIESGVMPSDSDTAQLVSMNWATIVFAACWVLGIVGAWVHGRAQDKLDEAAQRESQGVPRQN